MSFPVVLVVFVLGLAVGSFLNVFIQRTMHGEDFVKGRSRCDGCKKEIAWYDNIPLLSYLLLRGRCRYCGERISWQHPAMELLTGFLFVWWYVLGSSFFLIGKDPFAYIQPAFWLVVGILLLVIFMSDLLYMEIPTVALLILGGISLMYRLALGTAGIMRWEDVGLSLVVGVGLAVAFWLVWRLSQGAMMGMGDVWYVLFMGWLLGWPRALVAVYAAFILGGVVGVGFLLIKKAGRKSRIAFGPFLVVGTVVALLYGYQLWEWVV